MHLFKKYTNPFVKNNTVIKVTWTAYRYYTSCHFSKVDLCILDWWDPSINCVPSTLWSIYWLPIYFIFTPDIEWLKQLGTIKMACYKVYHSQMVARSVMWCQRCASFTGWKLRCFRVLAKCIWPSNKCSANLLEALYSFVKTLWSRIKNQLKGGKPG